ncbi:hypothetical protein QC762_610680 [Podospora pseudocomata]|uniref:chitinase n=1 Tax=Podospora pseudocomata TaxID=2093779 RepID=A0ABR0G9K8_9PEZI|nr:hypothetical protein QC762_610680 [Podospora pseudocomata]
MRLTPSFAPALGLLAWTSLISNVAAQVTTHCFPMNETCPPNPAFGMDYNFVFNVTPKFEAWETTVGPVKYSPETGAEFTINKQGDSPTIRSRFYIFWGRTEIWLKAAPGRGIISSIMLLSDNLDEIDWEFFGGNSTVAQSNYFGKNQPHYTNAQYDQIPSVQDDFHNYTLDWTKDYLDFYIDGAKFRRLTPEDAISKGDGKKDEGGMDLYPQTPMRISIGIWAGGDPSLPEGTREWAGGTTDYTKGPFSMFVKNCHVTDYSSGKEYVYGDRSGSWESIQIVEGNSTVEEVMNAPPPVPEKTMAEKWEELPNAAKIAIYAGGSSVGAAILFAALFYCIRQRRQGAKEATEAAARAEAERLEMERFRKEGINPDAFTSNAHEYNAKDMAQNGHADKDSYSVPPSPAPANEKFGNVVAMATAAAAGAGAGAGAAAARAANNGNDGPMSPTSTPLLREGAQSPRTVDPTNPFGPNYVGTQSARSPGAPSPYNPHEGLRSPTGSLYNQSMSPPPHQPLPHPPTRSMTNQSLQSRMGSPGPNQQQHGFDFGIGQPPQRSATTSPAPLAHPQPQRSFTTPTSGYGTPPQLQQQSSGYGNPPGPANGPQQGYWNGGNGGGGGYS